MDAGKGSPYDLVESTAVTDTDALHRMCWSTVRLPRLYRVHKAWERGY